MAKGRTVAVRITADTRGLVAGLTKADLTLNNFGKTARAAANVGGKALAAAAATAAASLAVLYARTSQAIDANAKLADRLNLSTEALAGLQYQADLNGVSNQSLTTSLEKMTKTVGEAITKGGAAADSFDRLGLSAK
jgi:phage shock protein A